MLNVMASTDVPSSAPLSRRDFLRGTLAAGAVGLSRVELPAAPRASDDVNCILLFLVGGPSQLDTWDMKPLAPSNIRSPFRPIRTNVPGIEICEHFPMMARMADRYAIVRSVHHDAAPVHETGQQLMQTGQLFRGPEHPHYGAVLSRLRGSRRGGVPPFVVLPGPIGNTGVSVSHGQEAGFLGPNHAPFVLAADPGRAGLRTTNLPAFNGIDPARVRCRRGLPDRMDADRELLFARNARRAFDLAAESDDLRDRYGRGTFGQSCLLARRLVEHGVRLVTVNMFDTVFDRVTWDCHADGGVLPTTLDDYGKTLCPLFDRAYAALLDDLHQRGMLARTLVLAMGEFGRTPQLNARGGRDHWPGVWSVLFAGGGVRGGQVVGASDRIGAEPRIRPVRPAEIAATVYRGLGIDLATPLAGPDNRPVPLVQGNAVEELFRG